MTIHNQPWLFGDEYLYLNKARNLKFGIDVITDATQGHKYPPLYSYLISLAITDDPVSSYRRVQFLNFFSSQLLLMISFFLLNKVFGFTKNKHGKLFLVLAFLTTSLLSNITGYYFVAMSENLFLPLTLLVFSVLSYILKFKQETDFKWLATLGILTAASILTRTIAIVLVPCIILALVSNSSAKTNAKNKLFRLLKTVLIFGVLSLFPMFVFELVERQLIQNNLLATVTKDYSSFMPSYSKNFLSLISLKSNLFATVKIFGNHLIYLVFSTFFFPFYFLIKDALTLIKTKKTKPTWLFVISYTLLTVGVSFLHSYGGFQNNPIRYSTYFRYLDSVVVIIFVYGLTQLWQFFSSKERLNKLASWLFIIFSASLVILLPQRDFYLTINSLGWGWLDHLLPISLLTRVALLLIVSSLLKIISHKKMVPILLGFIIVISISTIPVSLKMHNWLADDSQEELQEPVIKFAQENKNMDYFFNSQLLNIGERGSIYYIKYLLMFYTNEVVPMKPIETEVFESVLQDDNNSVVLLDSTNATNNLIDSANKISPINDHLMFAVFE